MAVGNVGSNVQIEGVGVIELGFSFYRMTFEERMDPASSFAAFSIGTVLVLEGAIRSMPVPVALFVTSTCLSCYTWTQLP